MAEDPFEWLIGPRPWTWKRIRRRCRGGCLACQWALVGAPIGSWLLWTKAQESSGRQRAAAAARSSQGAATPAARVATITTD
jgi:hypothetical protein